MSPWAELFVDSGRRGGMVIASRPCRPTSVKEQLQFRFWLAPRLWSLHQPGLSAPVVSSDWGYFFLLFFDRVTAGNRVCRPTREGIAPGIDYRPNRVRMAFVASNPHTLRAACENRQAQVEVNYRARLCKTAYESGSIQSYANAGETW
jgi:hypothetical protein